MNKRECRKNINNLLERITEDLTEILAYTKVNEGTKLSEMQALVFAKRRMVDLLEQVQLIFRNLVILKYLHMAENRTPAKKKEAGGFDDLFRRFGQDAH